MKIVLPKQQLNKNRCLLDYLSKTSYCNTSTLIQITFTCLSMNNIAKSTSNFSPFTSNTVLHLGNVLLVFTLVYCHHIIRFFFFGWNSDMFSFPNRLRLGREKAQVNTHRQTGLECNLKTFMCARNKYKTLLLHL